MIIDKENILLSGRIWRWATLGPTIVECELADAPAIQLVVIDVCGMLLWNDTQATMRSERYCSEIQGMTETYTYVATKLTDR